MSDSPAGYRTDVRTVEVAGRTWRLHALTDRQQFHDPDGVAEQAGVPPSAWPIFGVPWPAGEALAVEAARLEIGHRRILEIGCGLALPSLVLAGRGADITATDYQPLAGEFLRRNAQENGVPALPFFAAAWDREGDSLGRFDLLIGSDLVYEPDHPALLAAFIDRHASQPCEVVVFDPGRKPWRAFVRCMVERGWSLEERLGAFGPRGRMATFRR